MRQFEMAFIIAVICLIGQIGLAQDSSKKPLDYDSTFVRNGVAEKTRGKALLFALLPGSIIHGAGHFYAGSHDTGNLLFIFEIFGGVLLASGYKDVSSHEVSQSSGIHPGIVAGYVIFMTTWVYDIINAPDEAEKYNKQMGKAKKGLSVIIKDINSKKSLLLGFSYKF